VGSVSFTGEITGNLNVHVSDAFARLMTSAMLGIEIEEIEGEEGVHDVIGEFSNMIGGDIKSRFSDSGFLCELSTPYVTSGTDFKIESMDWFKHDRLAFRHQQHIALVEVFLKAGN
jgi:chemotaxis protein CheX